MSDSVLLRDRQGAVLRLTFNRPEKLNAFNDDMSRALIDALSEAEVDRSVRAVILRGAGRGYSSGQDLEAFMRLRTETNPVSVAEHLRRSYNVVATKIRGIEKPVIASLNGIAAGVGLSIALMSDMRIAADDVVLTLGFSKIGLVPDGGASLMLPLLAGFGRGLELAWTSDRIDATEAYRLGLVNRVVAAAELEAATLELAQQLADMSPTAIGLTKRAFNRAMIPHLAEWLENKALVQEEAANGPDLLEGVRSFMDKRKPAFAAR